MTTTSSVLFSSAHQPSTFDEDNFPEFAPNVLTGGEIFDVAFLSFVSAVGSFGNLLIIFSIIYAKRVKKKGNVFFINLAIADLLVTGVMMPIIVLSVVKGRNVLRESGCKFTGFLLGASCSASMSNLALIAFSRYWAVVRQNTYNRVFSVRNCFVMVFATWVWSCLMLLPALTGWSRIIFDVKISHCSYDDSYSVTYTVALMLMAIGIPMSVIAFSYWRLYTTVKGQGRTIRRHSTQKSRSISINTVNNSMIKRNKREANLLKTLAVTIILFVVCWTPYAVVVLFFSHTVSSVAKTAVSRLCISNSFMNFIIYGVMNSVFRRGYKNFIIFLCSCCGYCERSTLERSLNLSTSETKNKFKGTKTAQYQSSESVSKRSSSGVVLNNVDTPAEESTPSIEIVAEYPC